MKTTGLPYHLEVIDCLKGYPTSDFPHLHPSSSGNKMVYKKHFIALESNPDLFTRLIHELGVSEDLAFHDVLSLAEPDLLGMIPRPVLALVIVFPTPSDYEDRLARENESTPAAWSNGNDADVVWFKQTINNACGLYGILHAITNGPARQYISKADR